MTKKVLALAVLTVMLLTMVACASAGDNPNYIGKDKAQKISLDFVGYTEDHRDSLSDMKVKLVDGATVPYYLVDFNFGLHNWKFKIGAEDGSILSYNAEILEEYT